MFAFVVAGYLRIVHGLFLSWLALGGDRTAATVVVFQYKLLVRVVSGQLGRAAHFRVIALSYQRNWVTMTLVMAYLVSR